MFDEVAVRAVVAAAGERDAGDAAGDGVAAVLNDLGGHPVLAALPAAVLVAAADRRVAVDEGAGCRGETDRQERSIHENQAHLSVDEPEDSRAAVAAHPRPLSESAGASVTHSDSASRVSGPQIADGVPLEGTLEAVLQRVAATSIRGVAAPGAFAMRATDACAVAAAERRLVACAANVRDGRLDRWLNRRVSWRLSLALARHPSVTPNRISLASIVVGLTGALLVAIGGYWTRLAGLAVIQLASVLDCVDGEVARLTLRESRRGEWLDIAGDTIAHVALFVAIGLAVAADGGAHAVRLGAVLAAGALTSFACVTYAERSEAARRRAGGALNRAIDVLVAALSTRDFHAVVFVFAAADRLGFFLIGAAVGAHVWWIALLILLVLAGRAGVSVPFR
jgi:phosphatidylglycerophosphate synthase